VIRRRGWSLWLAAEIAAAVGLAALLAGCGSITAHKARTALVGLPVADLTACAGIPDRTADIGPDERVLDLTYQNDKPLLAMKVLTAFDVSLGGVGACHALFRVRDGKVVAVHYSGTETGLEGANAACGPIVRDCLH